MGIKHKFEDVEEWIIHLEDRVMEKIKVNKRKKIITNETRLRDLCDIIKLNNIHITGIPEREERSGQKTY